MRTAIVSDLHLGTTLESDLLRLPEPRRALLEEIAGAERVVLLGDVLELRQGPVAGALDAAGPFFTELGDALGDRQVVVVPGNHDHQLVGNLLDRARIRGVELGLQQVATPRMAGPLAEWLARRLGPATLELAYPGLWVRPDVYATHGHYLDAHLTVPRVECLAVSVVQRLVGRLPPGTTSPSDYEAVLSPVYALAHALAQATSATRGIAATELSARVWRRVDGASSRDLGAKVLGGVVIPGAVAALNRVGFGPFRADLSGEELRRAGLAAMTEVVRRLGVLAGHVVFGHTHRPGPLPGDEGFAVPGGPALVNTGSWILDRALGGGDVESGPYRPGVVCWIDDEGAPELRNALDATALPAAG